MPKTTDNTEFARIGWLSELHGALPSGGLGIGDDCAIVGGQCVSVDAQVEGVHFRRDFADWRVLGRRAAMAALSDVCAMGARPSALFVSLVLPAAFDEASFRALNEGLADGAREAGAGVAGGNLSRGDQVVIDLTAMGPAPEKPLLRSGARVGDGVFVVGFPGAAALGLKALLAGRAAEAPRFVEAWRAPTLDVELAASLAGRASAAIDMSDGFAQDLAHICRASNVSARVNVGALPRLPDFERICASFEMGPTTTLVGGGEVYALCFTAPLEHVEGATRVGEVIAQLDTMVLDERGNALVGGHDHFG